MPSSLLVWMALVVVLFNSAHSLTCYHGDEETASITDEQFDYCVRTKNLDSKKLSYGGSNYDVDFSRGDCFIQYDTTEPALNANCYCSTNNCNTPGPFNPKY